MNQKIIHNWQHSPSETQVASNPVKAVSKLLQQTKSLVFTNEDLMGLLGFCLRRDIKNALTINIIWYFDCV